ncbi:hypothetical protein AAFF_G00062500, partial [Aldrovandia affinis]
LILGVLDSLSADQLDRFKHKLSARQEIGYGLIEKESNMAVTKRIISNFTKKKAIAHTAKVLREIGLRDQAEDLEEAYARQGASSVAGMGDTGGRASDSSFTQTEVSARPQPAGKLILATRSQPLGATRGGNRMNIEPAPAHKISQTGDNSRNSFLNFMSCRPFNI